MNPIPSTREEPSAHQIAQVAQVPRRSPRRLLQPLGLLTSALLLLGAAGPSQASTLASADISGTSIGNSEFAYTITLNNIGTTNIQTLWYAWIPGQDYLATRPTNITSPAGWSAIITGGSSGDGFAIQWSTSIAGDALTTGSSFSSFSFDSTDTPSAIAGNSVFFPSTPVGTSFVYQGTPFSGGSDQFVVASVPEPSTYAVIGVGLLFLCGWRRLNPRPNS